jgi:predicted PurR-regulated permease PerM
VRFSPKSIRQRFAAQPDAADVPPEESPAERELAARLRAQWEEGRAARRESLEIKEIAGPVETEYRAARVPYGVELAAAWSWRFLVIAGALGIILYLVDAFMIVVLPLAIALFIAAFCEPIVSWMSKVMPRKVSAFIVVVLGIALVAALATFVGAQLSTGFTGLSAKVVDGIGKIQDWLRSGPLHITDKELNQAIAQIKQMISESSKGAINQATEVGTAVGHTIAGAFIILFGSYFFMADGALIWSWVVRLFPRAGRLRADSSGRVAWKSLTQFVRATVLVAATDALGIMIVAAVLGLPLVGPIGVLVFLGAFVPMIGAFISGTAAVLVALVAKGPVVALIMFGGVVVVQQIEAHVLQPFLMGRFVSVHPLGVIVAIAVGVLVAGVPGALIAVPLVASLNAVGLHLADLPFDSPPDPVAEQEEALPESDESADD